MMAQVRTMEMCFGFDAPPIGEQIKSQGFECKDIIDADRWERARQAISILSMWQIITQAETKNADKRLMKKIKDGVRFRKEVK